MSLHPAACPSIPRHVPPSRARPPVRIPTFYTFTTDVAPVPAPSPLARRRAPTGLARPPCAPPDPHASPPALRAAGRGWLDSPRRVLRSAASRFIPRSSKNAPAANTPSTAEGSHMRRQRPPGSGRGPPAAAEAPRRRQRPPGGGRGPPAAVEAPLRRQRPFGSGRGPPAAAEAPRPPAASAALESPSRC